MKKILKGALLVGGVTALSALIASLTSAVFLTGYLEDCEDVYDEDDCAGCPGCWRQVPRCDCDMHAADAFEGCDEYGDCYEDEEYDDVDGVDCGFAPFSVDPEDAEDVGFAG